MSRQAVTTSDVPVALVTGAGRRVGNVIARVLARHGYRLALHSFRASEEAKRTARELHVGGTEALTLTADLRDESATRRMVAAARDHFGRIDVLVNNAAIWLARPLEQITAADVREHFEVNVLATFVCCQEVGLAMVDQEQGGAIVNIGDWAIVRPYLDHAAYFASKGSIPTITRTMAVELGSRNPRVRVNAVLPGPVAIPASITGEERQRIVEATLVKREGTAEDLADGVLFLVKNSFVTGVCLPIDGGRSVFAPAWDG